ncbi:hypothetical protein DITRI_Ditri03aG0098300 [Diplodiscus trichospermus]
MVSIMFFGFVLMLILVLAGESSAQSQVMDTALAADGSGFEPTRQNLPKLGKEAEDAMPAAAEAGNSRLEGRKMMLKWDVNKQRVSLSVEGSDGEESAKISGHGANALNNQIGSSQKMFKNQEDDRNVLKTTSLSSANPEVSRKHSVELPNTNRLCSRDSKPVSDKGSSECFSRSPKLVSQESDNNSLKKLQLQKLHGAVKELVNFMNEDYRQPPTKPPVHNKAPLDQEQAIP